MANFNELQSNPVNNHCVDCGKKGCQWASVNNGVFICLECSGRHRALGTHISFVRSVNMDAWSETQFKFMQAGGNPRFTQVAQQFGLQDLDIPAKYNSQAAKWHRSVLRAEIDGQPAPPPPSRAEAALPVVYERKAEPQVQSIASAPEPQPEEAGGGWFGSLMGKASSWAAQAKESLNEAKVVDTLKSSAASLYDKSKEMGNALYDKSREVGHTVIEKSKDVSHQLYDRSVEVGATVVETSKEVGHAVVERSKEAGAAVIEKSAEYTGGIARSNSNQRKNSLDEMLADLALPVPKAKKD